MEKNAVERQPVREFKATNLYYLTRSAVLAVMALFVSLLVFNYVYAHTPIAQALAMGYNSYNAGPLLAGLLHSYWLYAVVKCLLIVGTSVWAMVRIRRDAAAAALPLFILAGLLLLDMLVPMAYVLRSLFFVTKSTGSNAMPILAQSVRLLFYFAASLSLFIVILCAAVGLSRYSAGRAKAPAPPRKSISGIGGWMIICTIRSIFMPLNFFYSLIIAMGGYMGIHSFLVGPETYLNMEIVLLFVLGLVLSIVVVSKLFKKNFGFKPLAISLEGLTMLVNGLSVVYMLTRTSSQYLSRVGYYSGGLVITLGMIVASAIFILYYAKSDRVKNTFQRSLWPAEDVDQ